ncbi:hypothetical protein DES41_102721 [Pseudorhodoferax soli]|uniref:Uncharacterized protein n=2 Tax=Pseudorhodoferax soli TaxID=545864 RepID=A0A368Y503_9BURK|nr:hypothetical protein DES41_102721 [Pseudorhodoferax soli]
MLARMETSEAALLGREWTALHRDCEASERSALWIKLGAVALTAMAVALSFDAVLTIVLVGVLWVQEAIVRTGQSRLVDRLLHVEGLLRDPMASPRAVCQLYSDWLATRPGPMGLLAEYLAAAARPTVAFPYAVLVVVLLALSAVG